MKQKAQGQIYQTDNPFSFFFSWLGFTGRISTRKHEKKKALIKFDMHYNVGFSNYKNELNVFPNFTYKIKGHLSSITSIIVTA